MKRYFLLIALIAFLFVLPLKLLAHKVNIYAYTDGEMVYSESYFADGSRCKNCAIEVYDKNTGKILIKGKADENGKLSFRIPHADSLKLVLKAGTGHQSSYYLNLKETAGTDLNKKAQDAAVVQNKRLQGRISKEGQNTSHLEKQKCLSSAEMESIVSQAVDKKLQPLMSQVAMIQENTGKAGIAEIFGGIGYIIGIMGIIMYFKSRKNMGK